MARVAVLAPTRPLPEQPFAFGFGELQRAWILLEAVRQNGGELLASQSLLEAPKFFEPRRFPDLIIAAQRGPIVLCDRNSGRADARGGTPGHRLLCEELSEGSVIFGLGHRGFPQRLVGRDLTWEVLPKGFRHFRGMPNNLALARAARPVRSLPFKCGFPSPRIPGH